MKHVGLVIAQDKGVFLWGRILKKTVETTTVYVLKKDCWSLHWQWEPQTDEKQKPLHGTDNEDPNLF